MSNSWLCEVNESEARVATSDDEKEIRKILGYSQGGKARQTQRTPVGRGQIERR